MRWKSATAILLGRSVTIALARDTEAVRHPKDDTGPELIDGRMSIRTRKRRKSRRLVGSGHNSLLDSFTLLHERSTSASPTYASSTEQPTWSPTSYAPTDVPSRHPTVSPSSDPTRSPTFDPTRSPTRSPLSVTPGAYNGGRKNLSGTCTSPHASRIRVKLVTDEYPSDVSWEFIDHTNNIILLASPSRGYGGVSPGGDGREAPVTDVRELCLDARKSVDYEFVVRDDFADGLCCRAGTSHGYYKLMEVSKGGGGQLNVLASGSNFKAHEVRHRFWLQERSNSGTPPLEQSGLLDFDGSVGRWTSRMVLVCHPPQRKIIIQIKTDDFGEDTSWDFQTASGSILAQNEGVYASNQLYERDVCVDEDSLYRLRVMDEHGDGMCCRYGKGHYKVLTHKREAILHGGAFLKQQITHLINTTIPSMSERDVEYLHSHNKRRRYWHAHYNATYVPLIWSESLKAEAQVWADALLDDCGNGMYHDPRTKFGENLAGNAGGGSWGSRKSPDSIIHRFVDREVGLSWPDNAHLTQALWWASKYVGCAEAYKKMERGNNRQCHTQVCRYARCGNCDMGSYKDNDGNVDWETAMMQNVNYCGPICPSGGCQIPW
ncbi:hypothetical protein ACHAWF_008028 [Thalassiosira exigua]